MNPPIKRRNFTSKKEVSFICVTFLKSEITSKHQFLQKIDAEYLQKRSFVQLLNRWCVQHTEGEWIAIQTDIVVDNKVNWRRNYDTKINYYFEKEIDAMAFKLVWD